MHTLRNLWGAIARQTLLGLIAVAVSLPLLLFLSRALGVGTPPLGGVVLLGGSALAGFAGGGLLGAWLGSRRNLSPRRAGTIAALLGLVYGILLCSAILPLYIEDAMDQITERGTEMASEQFDAAHLDPKHLDQWERTLDHPSEAIDQITDLTGKFAEEWAVSLPALALLGWTLAGPALAAPLEARRARKRLLSSSGSPKTGG